MLKIGHKTKVRFLIGVVNAFMIYGITSIEPTSLARFYLGAGLLLVNGIFFMSLEDALLPKEKKHKDTGE